MERTIKLNKTYKGAKGLDGYSFLVKGVEVDLSEIRFCPRDIQSATNVLVDVSTTYHFGQVEELETYHVWIQPCDEHGNVIYGEGWCEEEQKYLHSWVMSLYDMRLKDLPSSVVEARKIAIDHAKNFLDIIHPSWVQMHKSLKSHQESRTCHCGDCLTCDIYDDEEQRIMYQYNSDLDLLHFFYDEQ